MKICELINDNYLTDESDGKKVFQDFTRERKQMQYLFESFVANFYKKHKSEHDYKYVYSQKRVKWYNLSSDEESNQYLPTMQPDIILDGENRKVILDTKYYKEALKEKDVVGIVVGTRPDCLPKRVLQKFSKSNL